MGIECNPIPTAVLSTHTGDIKGYTFRDLTNDILPIAKHWKDLNIIPDSIYTGYLGSVEQTRIIKNVLNIFFDCSPFIIVDPAMADSGNLYTGFDKGFVKEMISLCDEADLIIPNLTEACLICDAKYKTSFNEIEIKELIKATAEHTRHYVVLTGVSFSDDEIGYYAYDKTNGNYHYGYSKKYPGLYYGTGDIFASVLTGCITKNIDIFNACDIALEFTSSAICETFNKKTDPRFGVAFEKYLPDLFQLTGGNNNELR